MLSDATGKYVMLSHTPKIIQKTKKSITRIGTKED